MKHQRGLRTASRFMGVGIIAVTGKFLEAVHYCARETADPY